MSTHAKLARSAGTIGAFTGVSRVLGFVRDLVIAAAFGTGVAAEAFVVSFKIPNLLRDLVGEGATNAAFVPVLTETREKRPAEFWPLVSTLFFAMAGILLALAALGVFFAPAIVRLIAPGFESAADPSKFPLTVELTRVIFPYIFLIGLSALAMGVLHSLGEFSSSAAGPILLNLCMIAAGVFFERAYGPMALVVGVLAGGVLQLAWQVPPLVKAGFRFTPPAARRGEGRKIGKLLLPRAFGSALYQINVFVDSILASFEPFVGPGGQSALYYANRLFQLPLAVFGVALAQAILPTFSTQIVRGDTAGFKQTFSVAMRSLVFVSAPATIGLAVLAEPIVRIVFEHGRFDAYSTGITSSALFWYAFGLTSCCFIKILVNGFYAMQDTKTPVRTMFVSVGVNVILSLALMGPLKIGGLALASSLSATLNVALLYVSLRKRVGPLGGRAFAAAAVRMVAAGALMGAFAAAWSRFALDAVRGGPAWLQGAYLAFGILLSVSLYFASSLALGVDEARKLLSWKQGLSPKR